MSHFSSNALAIIHTYRSHSYTHTYTHTQTLLLLLLLTVGCKKSPSCCLAPELFFLLTGVACCAPSSFPPCLPPLPLPFSSSSTESGPGQNNVEHLQLEGHPEMGPGARSGEWVRSDRIQGKKKHAEAVGGASFGCECYYYVCILTTTMLMQSHDPNKHFLVTYFSAANRTSTF